MRLKKLSFLCALIPSLLWSQEGVVPHQLVVAQHHSHKPSESSVDQSIVARETEAIVALLRVLNVPVAHRQRLRDGALTPEAWKDWLAMTNQWVHEAHAQEGDWLSATVAKPAHILSVGPKGLSLKVPLLLKIGDHQWYSWVNIVFDHEIQSMEWPHGSA